MADVGVNTTYADAATAISQGKRHLLVQDYTAAVMAFAEGLEMMSQKLSDCDDEFGEPYLLYGRALIGLAREEAGVLGGGVPGSEDAEDDEDGEEEDGEDEKISEVDEKEEESEVTEGTKETTELSVEATEKKTDSEEKKEEKAEKDEKQPEKEKKVTSNETDDKKIEEQKIEKSTEKITKPEVESVAGSSKVQTNGSASNTEKDCNGTAGKSDETEDGEDVNKDDEEDPGRGIDLQVAWEVLELAKIVFTKRGEAGLKNLAETHRLLGEVAMESDNPQGAITDLEGALKLLQKMEPGEPRAIAEIHYQLGLAHSLLNDFDASIGQFNEATTLLEARIKQLEDIKEPSKSDDPFYTVNGEIKELKELLPAIQEKITDMKDFKDEAYRLVIEGIKNKVAGGCTNGAGSSNDGASSSSQSAVSPKNDKPASDISHLVRKKRKADDSESPAQSPCKKPTP